MSRTVSSAYRLGVNFATEPDTLAELIADCAEIPQPSTPVALPREAAAMWVVDDACHARVAELDEYV